MNLFYQVFAQWSGDSTWSEIDSGVLYARNFERELRDVVRFYEEGVVSGLQQVLRERQGSVTIVCPQHGDDEPRVYRIVVSTLEQRVDQLQTEYERQVAWLQEAARQ